MSNPFFGSNSPPGESPFAISTSKRETPSPDAAPDQSKRTVRFAWLGWLLPLVVLFVAPAFVGLHFVLYDLRLWWWWLPLVVMLLLSFGTICYTFARLPPVGRETGRGVALGHAIAGIIFLVISGSVFAVCAVPMSVILYVKSDAGQQAIHERKWEKFNKQQERALYQQQVWKQQRLQNEANRQAEEAKQRAAYQARQAELAARIQREQQEAERKRKAAADRARAETERLESSPEWLYTKGLVERITTGDTTTPLPEPPAKPVPLDKFAPKLNVRRNMPIEVIAESEELVDDRLSEQGMSIQRLKLDGTQFVPTAVFYLHQDVWQAVLLRRDGRLLEISTTDWKQERRREFGGECCNLTSNGPYLCVVRRNPGAIYVIPTSGDQKTVDEIEIPQPEQCTIGLEPMSLHVSTSGEPPLHARLDKNYKLTSVAELSRAWPRGSESFAPSQFGRELLFDPDWTTTYVARTNGIFQARISESSRRFSVKPEVAYATAARLAVAGDGILFTNGTLWVPQPNWKQIIPAEQIRPDVFARFGHKLLATCSDSTNLQICDLEGNLKSSHTWPDAGKTVAVVGVRHLDQLLVFTERQVLVVAPAE